MTFGMPWTIGHGAENDEIGARILANAATRDSQGVLLPGDLKVHQTGTASGDLEIDTGAAVIRCAQAPGQSYIGPVPSVTVTSPARNDTAADRYDMIIGRIIDPEYSPWEDYTDPEEIAHGPYWEPHVISGVASNAKKASEYVSYSALELARVRCPAHTASWDNSMITDLRKLAQPRIAFAYDVQAEAGADYLALGDTVWRDWPTANSLSVEVPEWATHATTILTIGFTSGEVQADAEVRVKLASQTGPTAIIDHNASGPPYDVALTVFAYGEFDVRALQGQTVVVKPQARRTYTGNTGFILADPRSQILFDVRFSERVV